MTLEAQDLRSLVDEVGRFYVRDRELTRAQKKMAQTIGSGETPSAADLRQYVRIVRRYFSEFEREAHAHLRNVDGRLARVSQEQFNLSAERGVAARRVEATAHVLAKVSQIDPK